MLVDANIFQPLISVFATVIQFFHTNLGIEWGWSIILLTVCVRLVMIPLAFKQYHSMRRMQQHQPEMKAIQKRYKQDKQRQQQEMMKFYKENGINPMASCLPLVAQLPVFVSLYYMLRDKLRIDICPAVQHAFRANYAAVHHITLKAAQSQTTYCTDPKFIHDYVGGAGFLFIKDITNQAHGLILIVLCVMYVGTQMASTLLMSAPTMDKTQQRMMALMPIVFVLFILGFPAGLLIYWITSNAWTMVQQYSIKKVIGAPIIPQALDADDEPEKGRSNGRGALGGSSGESGRGRLMSMLTPQPNRADGGGKATSEPVGRGASSGKPAAKGKNAGGVATKRATPPPSARKKKKRSGRKR